MEGKGVETFKWESSYEYFDVCINFWVVNLYGQTKTTETIQELGLVIK